MQIWQNRPDLLSKARFNSLKETRRGASTSPGVPHCRGPWSDDQQGAAIPLKGNKTFRAQQLCLEAKEHTGLESQDHKKPAAYKEEGKDEPRPQRNYFAFSSFAPSQLRKSLLVLLTLRELHTHSSLLLPQTGHHFSTLILVFKTFLLVFFLCLKIL